MQLIPETAPLDGVLLTWPHPGMGWHNRLEDVYRNFIAMAVAISKHSRLLIAINDLAEKVVLQKQLTDHGVDPDRLLIMPARSNDVWARDHGPIAIADDGRLRLLDFQFNGWGGKFPAALDNLLTRRLAEQNAFNADLLTLDMVLEGGSIDTNGKLLLTTKDCLLNPNRNPYLTQDDIEFRLRQWFGVDHVIWVENGHMLGDDTDSHVDTIARLVHQTLIFQGCTDVRDPHFNSLNLLEQELISVADKHQLSLVALPLPKPIYGDEDERLPASYANFLVVNQAIILPIYGCEEDAKAITILRQALPDYKVEPVNCSALVRQYGSLHCATMQLPEGTLNLDLFGSPKVSK